MDDLPYLGSGGHHGEQQGGQRHGHRVPRETGSPVRRHRQPRYQGEGERAQRVEPADVRHRVLDAEREAAAVEFAAAAQEVDRQPGAEAEEQQAAERGGRPDGDAQDEQGADRDLRVRKEQGDDPFGSRGSTW